ncbi:hypothetical protein ASO20_01360 [Mycoplasma sp. (ex Biomphalaria glabrata)]|uniref:F0F1 ATP synthase subunit B n=1 Tax=Mycoplasma sp. (ex Biomphalaria glabrata) TaxID=1749074 RepID=UPI00073AC07F|nr:F0F1 ATP synthase subunit B [Mycoplasma sp. (ex Biomphalaria glabrata)]ALV23300.1 hypothetical protein ASO20_01360 [Mycoplasma sp. (ex Biomphalaria glabrata)]
MFFLIDIPDISNNLFPNLTTLISHIIATGVILLAVVKWVWKPFKKSLNDRTEYIDSTIKNAENSKLEAQNLEDQRKILLEDARKEAKSIIEDARISSMKLKDKLILETHEHCERLKDETESDIQRNRLRLQQETKKEVVEVAKLIAEKVIAQNIDIKIDEKMVDSFINEVRGNY